MYIGRRFGDLLKKVKEIHAANDSKLHWSLYRLLASLQSMYNSFIEIYTLAESLSEIMYLLLGTIKGGFSEVRAAAGRASAHRRPLCALTILLWATLRPSAVPLRSMGSSIIPLVFIPCRSKQSVAEEEGETGRNVTDIIKRRVQSLMINYQTLI